MLTDGEQRYLSITLPVLIGKPKNKANILYYHWQISLRYSLTVDEGYVFLFVKMLPNIDFTFGGQIHLEMLFKQD